MPRKTKDRPWRIQNAGTRDTPTQSGNENRKQQNEDFSDHRTYLSTHPGTLVQQAAHPICAPGRSIETAKSTLSTDMSPSVLLITACVIPDTASSAARIQRTCWLERGFRRNGHHRPYLRKDAATKSADHRCRSANRYKRCPDFTGSAPSVSDIPKLPRH